MRGRSVLAGALAGSALLIAPAPSQGAFDFGSSLNSTPDPETCGPPSCTVWNSALHPASTQGTLTSPISGVVVRFTIKTALPDSLDPDPSPLHLRVVSPFGGGLWRGLAASSPNVTPTAAVGLQTFPARVSIAQGDYLGIEFDSVGTYFLRGNAVFGATRESVVPALPSDGSAVSTTPYNAEILLQGRVEPDKDGDGFGDETQDKCAGQKGPNAGCPAQAKKKCKKKKRRGKKTAAVAKKKKCKKRKKKK